MTIRFDAVSLEDMLTVLRKEGWSVAVHNDYKQTIPIQEIVTDNSGMSSAKVTRVTETKMTFWLFTHECGVYVKGEAPTDKEAVLLCAKAAHEVFAPSP